MRQSFTDNETDDILALQKKSISYAAFDFLGSFALFALLCGGLLAAGLCSKGTDRMICLCAIMPLCLLPTAWFLINVVRCFRIRRQVMNIQESNTHEVQIACKKVRFLFHPKDRRNYEITALLLRNEYDEEYCYVFPRGSEPLDREKKLVRQHFEVRRSTLLCYRSTRIIKVLDVPYPN